MKLQSSDDESLAEEEAEALRLQRKAAESLTMADVGLGDENQDESDKELTLEVGLEHDHDILIINVEGFGGVVSLETVKSLLNCD